MAAELELTLLCLIQTSLLLSRKCPSLYWNNLIHTAKAIRSVSKQVHHQPRCIQRPAERETSQQTADLCMTLFTALGVEEVSLKDIDTAHRVPSRA